MSDEAIVRELTAKVSGATELEIAFANADDRHVRRALAGVSAYAHAGKGMDPTEPLQEIIEDLLCDLRHLAREVGLDFEAMSAGAEQNFRIETEG